MVYETQLGDGSTVQVLDRATAYRTRGVSSAQYDEALAALHSLADLIAEGLGSGEGLNGFSFKSFLKMAAPILQVAAPIAGTVVGGPVGTIVGGIVGNLAAGAVGGGDQQTQTPAGPVQPAPSSNGIDYTAFATGVLKAAGFAPGGTPGAAAAAAAKAGNNGVVIAVGAALVVGVLVLASAKKGGRR